LVKLKSEFFVRRRLFCFLKKSLVKLTRGRLFNSESQEFDSKQGHAGQTDSLTNQSEKMSIYAFLTISPFSRRHTHTHSLSLSYTHTHTHSYLHTRTHSLTYTHSFYLNLKHPLFFTQTHTHSLIPTHTHTLSISTSYTLTFFHTHTYTHWPILKRRWSTIFGMSSYSLFFLSPSLTFKLTLHREIENEVFFH